VGRSLLGNSNGAGDTETGRDINGNTLYDYLTVTTTINITQTGTYYVAGILRDSGNNTVAEAGIDTAFTEGTHPVSLDFSGTEIFHHGTNGPYNVSLVLWATSRESFAIENRSDFLQTDPYSFTEFEGSQAYISGSYSDTGTDLDGDGVYEYLTLSKDFTVTRMGNYRLEGYLETGNSSTVVYSTAVLVSSPGTVRIPLNFDGEPIGQSRKNGPYKITALALYDADKEIQFIPYATDTAAYQYTDFIPAPVIITGPFRDYPIDHDRNGVYEYLAVETGVTADVPGTYVLSGVLTDAAGAPVASAANLTPLPAGGKNVLLLFAGGDIYRHGVSGNYTLALARISGQDLVSPDQVSDGYSTGNYDYHDFTKPAVLESRFEAAPQKGAPPLAVQFTDMSSGSPKSWNWSFGDGNISGLKNPVHIYSASGLYTVNLSVASAYGTNQTVKTQYINVTSGQEPVVARFTANVTQGTAPLVVQFTDTSLGEPTTWWWRFGGADLLIERNPVYTFNSPGNYSVYLEASRSGSWNISPTMNIRVFPAGPPMVIANFTANRTSGSVPFSVRFTDTSAGSPSLWNWSFGDGNSSSEQNVSFTYTAAGTYTVSLNATNAGGSNTTTRQSYIHVQNDGDYTLDLTTGWNFVSVPKTLKSTNNTGLIFKNVDSAGHSVWLYNASTMKWTAMTAATKIRVLDGIWIYSRSATAIPLYFENDPLQTPPTKMCYPGWNAIGFSDTSPVSAHDTFVTLGTTWSTLIGYDAGQQKYSVSIIRGATDLVHGDQLALEPGQGYWVFLTGSGELAAISA
jgi:PKD repeat protein